MQKKFNITGTCIPERHYMVDLMSRLAAIKVMVDEGDYFMINRARQYGKTTMLRALAVYLRDDYEVVSLDFQRLSSYSYENESNFVSSLSRILLRAFRAFPERIREQFDAFAKETERQLSLPELFQVFEDWCEASDRPVVLLIDEVDTATNHHVFFEFLTKLRESYLNRDVIPTFQSVILAGVYDVRTLKRKIRLDEAHQENSPWITSNGKGENSGLPAFDDGSRKQREFTPFDIAVDFEINFAFCVSDIVTMLAQYENDYHTGMDVKEIAVHIYTYTTGYPVLVSDICKIIDEKLSETEEFPTRESAWTINGVNEAVKRVTREDHLLFDSLVDMLKTYPEMEEDLKESLFNGKNISYETNASYLQKATMLGFIRNENGKAVISNKIFESFVYHHFIAERELKAALQSAW